MESAPPGFLPQHEHQERVALIDPARFSAALRRYTRTLPGEVQKPVNKRLRGERLTPHENALVMEAMQGFEALWATMQERGDRLPSHRRSAMRSAPVARRTRTRTRERRSSARRAASRSAGGGDDDPAEPEPALALVWNHPVYGPVNDRLARFIVEHGGAS